VRTAQIEVHNVVWSDNETDRDLLNFQGVADTVAQFILQANGSPISVGVSGAWGVGKSSMIKLTQAALAQTRPAEDDTRFVFVEFNAWLYQGYDDARAALLDVVAAELETAAAQSQSGLDKVKEFMGRVRWLRLAKLVALPAAAVALGLPPMGLSRELTDLVRGVRQRTVDEEQIEKTGSALSEAGAGLLAPASTQSPPKEIQDLRNSFEAALEELGVTLVVLIDDLDRCLPETAISTLEAIRLLLFLKNTAFVIAADDQMIKRAVKKHFDGLDDDELVTNYFDKLIQVPIRVPALGIQEVRAYMMMLFIDNSIDIDASRKDALRTAIAHGLRQSWTGVRVDFAFVTKVDNTLPDALLSRLETAERLAPLMTGATHIVGNPRLIKRFMNALSIRLSIAKAQGVVVDEAVLAKLLLFERVVEPAVFIELATRVNENSDGRPLFLEPWETAARSGEEFTPSKGWDTEFVRDWLALEPQLANVDLRGALYVGREQAPLVTGSDKLSSAAAELLTALIEHPRESARLKDRLTDLPTTEQGLILDRLLSNARSVSSWGTPEILEALLTVAAVDPAWGQKLTRFLLERPHSQISASVVPKIADHAWAATVLQTWSSSPDIKAPVKRAITARGTRGDF
jgi:predicted KAP-like P-loop ATPase